MKTEVCAGKYFVDYAAGESRWHPDRAIDYMLAIAPDRSGDPIELYAEADTDPENEIATYDDLKIGILQEADENNVDPETLMFFYDRDNQDIEQVEI
jgi:hypothetical protein